jgi:ankyrin repeat protein
MTDDGDDTITHDSGHTASKLQTLVEVLRCELGRPVRSPGQEREFEPTKQWTTLYYAVYHSREAALIHFLRTGHTPDGILAAHPLLCVAVMAGHAGIVRILCEAGANIDAACAHSGETALHLAVKTERIEVLGILLYFKPDVNARTLDTLETPLHYAAARSGYTTTVDALLSHGANYEALNSHGCSPAEVALQAQNLDTAMRIIQATGGKAHKLTKEKRSLLDQVLQFYSRSPLDKDLVPEAFKLACPSDSTALVEAIKTRDASLVKLILERGSNPNEATASGLYPIFAAFNACSAPVVQVLVDHGADVTLRNPHGPNVLQAALASPLSRDKEAITTVFELLLSSGADARTTYSDGTTLLHRVVGEGHDLVKVLQLLLKHGLSVDAQDRNGNTALHVAAASESCVALLLKYGSDPDKTNDTGLTPLLNSIKSATSDNEPDLCELIKASNRERVDSTGKTALHWAARNGLAMTVKLLLEARADTTATDLKKRTPLLLAVHNRRWGTVSLFATQPGNNAWDENGLTALHHIAISTPKGPSTWKDITAAVASFCEKGVSRSMRDLTGSTPLIQAAKTLPEEGLPVLEALLTQKGSERSNCVAHEDHDQHNALYYATASSKVSFVAALLRHGSPFELHEWRPKPNSVVDKRILKLFAEHEWIRRMGRLHRQSSTIKDEGLLPKVLPIRELSDLLTMGLDPNRLPAGKFPDSLFWVLLDHSVSLPNFLSKYTYDALKLILGFGADPNVMSRKPPRTSKIRNAQQMTLSVHPLAHILEQCPWVSLELVSLLLDNGAKTSTASPLYDGRYPLHAAVRANRVDIVDVMLLQKSNIDCRDVKQRTPLALAAERGLFQIVDLLLRSDAEIDVVDVEGNTPLHLAAATGSMQAVSCLLRADAKATLENYKNLIPLNCLPDKLSTGEKQEITVLLEQAQEVERRKLSPPPLNSKGRAPTQGADFKKLAANEDIKLLKKPRNAPAQPTTISTNPSSVPSPTVASPTMTDFNAPHLAAKDTPTSLRLSEQLVSIRFTPPTPPTILPSFAPPRAPPASVNVFGKPRQTPRVDSGLDLAKASKEPSLPVLERNRTTFDPLEDVPAEDEELKSWLSVSNMLDRL